MFDSVRLPHKLDKAEFAEISERLREKLLEAQFEFLERKQKSLLLLINGSDGAGKGEVLNRLYEWLDDHSLETLSYGAPTEEERLRPLEWRYWRDMPPKGRIGLVLGGWHHRLLHNRAQGKISRAAFDSGLEEINRSEEMLRAEGVVIVKVWLHVEDSVAQKRLSKLRDDGGRMRRAVVIEWEDIKGQRAREKLARYALDLVEKTSTGYAPWTVVAAEDARYRDAAVAELLLSAIERANAESAAASPPPTSAPASAPTPEQNLPLPRASLVGALDLTLHADRESYDDALELPARALERANDLAQIRAPRPRARVRRQ